MSLRFGPIASVCVLVSMAAAQDEPQARRAAEPGMIERVKRSRHDLWKGSIRALDAGAKSQDLQRQIESLLATARVAPRKIERQSATQPAMNATSQAAASAGSGPAAPASQPATRPSGAKARPTKSGRLRLSAEVLAKLRRLSPKGVDRPIMLADSLYLGGYLAEAAEFYNMAMQREPTPQQRAWVLFQKANCKRVSDPAAARGLYRRLLAEQPNSLWGHLADVQQNLIEWRRVNRPRQILAAIEPTEKTQPSAGERQPSAQEPPAAGGPKRSEYQN